MKQQRMAGTLRRRADPLPHPRRARHRARHPRGFDGLVHHDLRLMWITAEDGVALEAHWDDAKPPAVGTVVFCHPHPLDGGTMRAPLMRTVAATLRDAGLHVLRFNFRGVGLSEGRWAEGIGEIRDVAAAVEAAGLAFPELPTGLAGWSFGASVSLGWQQQAESTIPWAGIAPGIRSYRGAEPPDSSQLHPASRLIVFGDRDQFASLRQMQSYAEDMGARLEILDGSDHFFHFRERQVGTLVAEHLGGRDLTSAD